MSKWFIAAVLIAVASSCQQQSNEASQEPEMYEASPLASMMRQMAEFSKSAKAQIKAGKEVVVPSAFFELKNQEGTRDEHKEKDFQQLADIYLLQLQGIERKDSQAYFYQSSIDACKTCHNSFCGGPLVVIEQLDLAD